MRCVAFLFIFFIFSCNDSLREKQKDLSMALGNVNQVEIIFFNKGYTLKYIEEKKNIIENFKDLFYQKNNDLSADTTGKTNFLENGKIVFEAFFSTAVTGSKTSSGYMTYTVNKKKYTVKLGHPTEMYLDNIFYTLKKPLN